MRFSLSRSSSKREFASTWRLGQFHTVHRWPELFLAYRYLSPKLTFDFMTTLVAIAGVSLGVWLAIVILSVMRGFEHEMEEKVIGFNAHLTVTNQGVMRNYEEVMAQVREHPEVEAVSPFVVGPVLVQTGARISTPYVKGIELDNVEEVIPLKDKLYAGRWIESPGEVLVGTIWAERQTAILGDKVKVYSPKNLQNLKSMQEGAKDQKLYLPAEYTIVGIYNTGSLDYDNNFILVTLEDAQDLYNLRFSVHGVAARIKNPLEAGRVRRELNGMLDGPVYAKTWIELQPLLFQAVAVERVVMIFITVIVLIVATSGVASALINVTLKRTKDIGIMKALGATHAQVVTVFTGYGLIVGTLGSFLGIGLAVGTLKLANPFRIWLFQTFQFDAFPQDIYFLARLPYILEWELVLSFLFLGIGSSVVAALVPSFFAARVDPVRTLQGQ